MKRKEEIVQAANNYKAQFPDGYIKEYVYIDAAEWADRTMIDKTCRWLLEHGMTQHVIERYRKDMEE